MPVFSSPGIDSENDQLLRLLAFWPELKKTTKTKNIQVKIHITYERENQ